jgi:hypothetical protein
MGGQEGRKSFLSLDECVQTRFREKISHVEDKFVRNSVQRHGRQSELEKSAVYETGA